MSEEYCIGDIEVVEDGGQRKRVTFKLDIAHADATPTQALLLENGARAGGIRTPGSPPPEKFTIIGKEQALGLMNLLEERGFLSPALATEKADVLAREYPIKELEAFRTGGGEAMVAFAFDVMTPGFQQVAEAMVKEDIASSGSRLRKFSIDESTGRKFIAEFRAANLVPAELADRVLADLDSGQLLTRGQKRAWRSDNPVGDFPSK